MKILIIADYENPYLWDYFDKQNFNDIDLIISCGDLKASYLSFLVTMIPVPVLYIHGNHDYRYADAPPEGCICIEDTIYNFRGLNIGGLGGSMEYAGGPQQYTELKMQKRVKKLSKLSQKKGGLDIFVSHAPTARLGDGTDLCHKGFECFYMIYDNLHPRYHLHGHQHLNYSAQATRIKKYDDIEIINGYGYYILQLD